MTEKRRHLLIAGTGRAGTSFLVKYLTEFGLDTHLSRKCGRAHWDENANAGLEDFVTNDRNLPYVVKTPWLYEYIGAVLSRDDIEIDSVIIPVRDIVEAASSRAIIERRNTHQGVPDFADNGLCWESWEQTPGGVVFSLNPLDQARLLALGFHRLIEQLVEADIPIRFLAFPRLASDADYLFSKLQEVLPAQAALEEARRIHARLADADKVRVTGELQGLGEGPPAASVRISKTGVKYPKHEELDAIALRREVQRLRRVHGEACRESEAARRQAAQLSAEVSHLRMALGAAVSESERAARPQALGWHSQPRLLFRKYVSKRLRKALTINGLRRLAAGQAQNWRAMSRGR
jgi:hypothetical protein